MAKIIGYDEKIFRKFTYSECGAVVQYTQMKISIPSIQMRALK
jgi:hypothetical protein